MSNNIQTVIDNIGQDKFYTVKAKDLLTDTTQLIYVANWLYGKTYYHLDNQTITAELNTQKKTLNNILSKNRKRDFKTIQAKLKECGLALDRNTFNSYPELMYKTYTILTFDFARILKLIKLYNMDIKNYRQVLKEHPSKSKVATQRKKAQIKQKIQANDLEKLREQSINAVND